jgi:hypothetical protein
MSSHYIERCKVCKKVMAQCRCMDCTKTETWSVCDDCKKTHSVSVTINVPSIKCGITKK